MKIFTAAMCMFLFVSVFAGCGDEARVYSKAYKPCIKEIMEEGERKNKGKIPEKLNRQLAEAACKIIETQCEKDPDGPVCQALLEKYGDFD